jgi:type VI secretion system protein ImpE
MTATDLFKAGRLQAAIDAQVQDVRADPADHGKRLFLFELLAFAGDWDRARRQIDAVAYPEPERMAAVVKYKTLLDAEDHRARVFRDAIFPEFFIPPPTWVLTRLEAVAALKAGDAAAAAEKLAASDEAAPPARGLLNGAPVDGLRDADDLFGPVLEVMSHGGYYWLPLEQVESIGLNPPAAPRDLIWFPAKLTIKDGPSGDAFLPARYPGSHAAANDAVRLGRATDWGEEDDQPVRGTGLRVFLNGDQFVSLLDWREFQTV